MNMKSAFRLIWFLSMLVVIVASVECDGTKSQERVLPTAAAQPPTAPSATTQEPDAYGVSGLIVVENQVDVAAQRSGLVARILAEVGQSVHKGDALALLDDRQVSADREAAAAKVLGLEADVKNWEAEVKVLQSDKDRANKMWEAQLITKEEVEHVRYKEVADEFELERARQAVQIARDQLRSLEMELEKTRIAAPFDGIVARRYVRAGQEVATGDRLFWVTAVSPLQVKFTLPEKYLAQLKRGNKLDVRPAEVPGPSHTAKVIRMSPVIDPSSGTIEVLAEVVGPAADFRPGMTVQIHLENLQ
jgi:RND family efflux transporter MFP subunit